MSRDAGGSAGVPSATVASMTDALAWRSDDVELGLGSGIMPELSDLDVMKGFSRLHAMQDEGNRLFAESSGSRETYDMGIAEMAEFDEELVDRLWDLVYEVDCDAELYNLLVWAFPDPAGRVEPEHHLTADEVRHDAATLSATGIPELERFVTFVRFWAGQRF